ncbi:MAG: hypothetical protein IT355_05920 [Gemmatimonadaceae bacterium]|nr:hypothetical protein [Gemmatimonadaceae bacterium]
MSTVRRLAFLLLSGASIASAQPDVFSRYVITSSGRWRLDGRPPARIGDFEPLQPMSVIEHDSTSPANRDSLLLRLSGRLRVVSCARGECVRPIAIRVPTAPLNQGTTTRRARHPRDSVIVLEMIRHQAALAADFGIVDGLGELVAGRSDIGRLLTGEAPRGLVAVLCPVQQAICMPDGDSVLIAPITGRHAIIQPAVSGAFVAHVFRTRTTTDGTRYESTGLRPAVVVLAGASRARGIARALDNLDGAMHRWPDPPVPGEREALRRAVLLTAEP